MSRLLKYSRKYTDAQVEALLDLVAAGMTQTTACRELGIAPRDISHWVKENEDFAKRWRVARMEQVHALGDEMLEIADAPMTDMVAAQRAKLRVETRKWLMAKWAPRHYGDRVHQDHTHTVGVVLLPALDTTQIDTLAAQAQQVTNGKLKQIAEDAGK